VSRARAPAPANARPLAAVLATLHAREPGAAHPDPFAPSPITHRAIRRHPSDELSPPPAPLANWLPAPGEQPLAMTGAALPRPATRHVCPRPAKLQPLLLLRAHPCTTSKADETAPPAIDS
jgi:hypothetical protein